MAQPVEQAMEQLPLYGLSLEAVREREAAAVVTDGITVETDVGPVERVENLVWIKGNTYYKEALDDWEKQKKSLGGKLERREKRAEELTNQVYNVVGFFSVFQGVILTAVTQLNSQSTPTSTQARPLCRKVWYPFTLSLLAAFAAVIGISLKFSELWSTNVSIQNFKLRLREAESRESLLQTGGERFFFKRLQLNERLPSPQNPSKWIGKAILVSGGVIVFTVLFCLSYFAILCDTLLF